MSSLPEYMTRLWSIFATSWHLLERIVRTEMLRTGLERVYYTLALPLGLPANSGAVGLPHPCQHMHSRRPSRVRGPPSGEGCRPRLVIETPALAYCSLVVCRHPQSLTVRRCTYCAPAYGSYNERASVDLVLCGITRGRQKSRWKGRGMTVTSRRRMRERARVEALRSEIGVSQSNTGSHLRLVFIMFCDSITLNFNGHSQLRFGERENRSPLLL
jgi:hypothetical protein